MKECSKRPNRFLSVSAQFPSIRTGANLWAHKIFISHTSMYTRRYRVSMHTYYMRKSKSKGKMDKVQELKRF
jgi:hypothetical protein